jgi:predicted cupin superfamily sugar epimerase
MTSAAPGRRSCKIQRVHPLVEQLGLIAHDEGGYFAQGFRSAATVTTPAGERHLMDTIYYLLTSDSPLGCLHRNRSDITHFLHLGGPVTYLTVSPEGELTETVMGTDLAAGQVLKMTVAGGHWKTSFLAPGVEECLISEAVVPAFDYADRELATVAVVEAEHPRLLERLRPYIHAP